MNVIIFGPPGVGKGTQSKMLVDKFNLLHISTGEIFRQHMQDNTEIGKIIDHRMKNGILIDDALTLVILLDAIKDRTDNLLLDGFPRTLNQAIALDNLIRVDHVIVLLADEEKIKERIEKRKETQNREDDDKFEKRMDEYFNKTIHTLKHYSPPILKMINANADAVTVFNDIVKKIQ